MIDLSQEVQLENIAVGENSAVVGLTVEETHQRTKASILAITRKSGKLLTKPPPEEINEAKDRLIILGTRQQLAAVEEICERCKANE